MAYPRSKQGLRRINPRFGLHTITRASLHHSAGPQVSARADVIRIAQAYDEHHYRSFGCGFSYGLHVDRLGRLYEGRPISWKGAHVGGQNTGNFGVMVHGDFTKYKPNALQRRALKRLYRGQVAGYEFLGRVPWKGHNEYPGPTNQGNACPGSLLTYLRWLRGAGR